MVVLFRCLCNEPIENVVTCLNFKVDKVVFFGTRELIAKRKSATTSFLTKYCDVKSIIFCELYENDMSMAMETIGKIAEQEKLEQNDVFCDITGGEGMILSTLSIVSAEMHLPMLMYDVPDNRMIDLPCESSGSIRYKAEARRVKLNLDMYIELMGGVINHSRQKSVHSMESQEDMEDIRNMWEIANKYGEQWSRITFCMRRVMAPNYRLHVKTRIGNIRSMISKYKELTYAIIIEMLEEMETRGLISNLSYNDEVMEFDYKNSAIRDIVFQCGNILELYVHSQLKKSVDDCDSGVILDWDGVIQHIDQKDVFNEIDVIAIRGNIPVFISCKSGTSGRDGARRALYELKSIADRFGGKYSEMILASTLPFGKPAVLRAAEMNIKIEVVGAHAHSQYGK